MVNIISLSGGKDSTAMLLMMIEKKMPIDRIIFVDTTKEFPGMYKHIGKLQKYILPLKIEKYKFDYDYWFANRIHTKGKSIGQKGFGWPDMGNRWCTQLKKDTFMAGILGNKINYKKWPSVRGSAATKGTFIRYIGIAADEQKRIPNKKELKEFIRYPLVEFGITEKEALKYCYSKGFDWGGLYEDFNRVSCWCCPLSRISELKTLYIKYPKLWQKLKGMDKYSWREFKSDYTLKELDDRFRKEESYCQLEL